MKRSIEPNIADRNAVLTSSEEADVLPNGQDSSPPATAHSGSAAPKMVGGSPEGRQTPLAIDGLANDSMQVPSSVAGAAGAGAFTIGPVSDPQLIVRTSSESEGSATASVTSPAAQAASPMLPTASLSTVASQSEIEEQYQLGLRAKKGKDCEKALVWFHKAAKQGHAAAQFYLGVMYERGEGIEKDLKQAASWYLKAAGRGNADAQFNLGVMYSNGEGVKKDLKQAAICYGKAAEQGHADAQYYLALMYEQGDGVQKDLEQAAKWYLKAAEQGHSLAQYYLAGMYEAGEGVEKDLNQAARWFEQAAEQGDGYAQFQLGLMYLKGWGVEKNVSLAAYWILQSGMDGEYLTIEHSLDQFPEFNEMFECVPDILRNNPEFKNVTFFKIEWFQLTPPYISLVDRLIRLNSNIQRIDIELTNLRYDEPQKFAFDNFVSQLVDTIQTFNTSLTNLNFLFLGEDGPELAQLNQVLAQNQSIATLRQYLQKHPAAHSDELPREVLMPLADQLIVQGCKSGQSDEAVKAELDEFLMSAQAGRLNVPIRQPVQ